MIVTCRLGPSCDGSALSNKEAATAQSESDGDTEGEGLHSSAPTEAEETNNAIKTQTELQQGPEVPLQATNKLTDKYWHPAFLLKTKTPSGLFSSSGEDGEDGGD